MFWGSSDFEQNLNKWEICANADTSIMFHGSGIIIRTDSVGYGWCLLGTQIHRVILFSCIKMKCVKTKCIHDAHVHQNRDVFVILSSMSAQVIISLEQLDGFLCTSKNNNHIL